MIQEAISTISEYITDQCRELLLLLLFLLPLLLLLHMSTDTEFKEQLISLLTIGVKSISSRPFHRESHNQGRSSQV